MGRLRPPDAYNHLPHFGTFPFPFLIPGRSYRTEPIVYDENKYKERNRVERFFNKLKQFRRIATRYEKHSFTFLAMIHIVAAFISARN
jgi:transposase